MVISIGVNERHERELISTKPRDQVIFAHRESKASPRQTSVDNAQEIVF
jgi:hypothetical protein